MTCYFVKEYDPSKAKLDERITIHYAYSEEALWVLLSKIEHKKVSIYKAEPVLDWS